MSKRSLQASPFLDAAQLTISEVLDFHIWFFPGLSDAVEASTSGFLSLRRETKFIIGFDFAVTLFPHLNIFEFLSTSFQNNL